MSAVLVTGGAGYIGSHAVKALVDSGQDVVIYDDLSAGHQEAARRGRRGRRCSSRGTSSTPTASRRTSKGTADAVMHFAAWLSVAESVTNPAGYYRNNVSGALSVLDAMVASGVQQLVFSSTCAVFGNPEQTPIAEDHPTRPINAYGETKLAIERALPHYERAYGLRSIALRYFNAAGADPDGELGEDHDPEMHVIPKAIDAAAADGTFQIFGEDYETPDGTCLRDYVHVADLASRTSAGARGARPWSAVHRLQPRQRPPTSVRRILQSVER
jgi:UDP-glucose-4-epimerase GalE